MQPFEITVPAAPRAPELLLSVPTHADVDRITEICQDPAIQEWTTVPSPYTRGSAVSFVEQVVARAGRAVRSSPGRCASCPGAPGARTGCWWA